MWMRREAGATRNARTRKDLAKSMKQSSEMKIDHNPAESRMWMRREAGAARNEGTRRDLAKSEKQSSKMYIDRQNPECGRRVRRGGPPVTKEARIGPAKSAKQSSEM